MSGRVVYTSGPGGGGSAPTRCRRCGGAPCHCGPQSSADPSKQAVRIRREKAGRAGKTVTTVGPLLLVRADAEKLLGELKRTCGCGGTLQEDKTADGRPCFVLEVQGDHAERMLDEMLSRGYPAKRAGG